MNSEFNLDFFYYQKSPILDGEDPQEVANRPYEREFVHYAKQAPILEVIELLVFVYSKKFASDYPWFRVFSNSIEEYAPYPDYLDTEVDIYLGKENTHHEDVRHLIFKFLYLAEDIPSKLEWIELELDGNQKLTELSAAVAAGFKDLDYTKTVEGETEFFTPNEESPIINITLSSTTFRMTLDTNKWIYYV